MKSIKGDYNAVTGHVAMMMAMFLLFGAVIFGQSKTGVGNADPASLSGTVTVEIPTAGGSVRVTLPDDMRAGDTISGTVVFPQTGSLEDQVVEVKTAEGEGVVVRSADPGSKMLKFVIPAGLYSIPFVLKNASGKHIGTAVVSVKSDLTGNIPTQPGNFAPPRIGQTGRSISIPGNFDGNASTTRININGRDLPVIAESPRKSVVQIPADTPTGPRPLTVRENQSSQQTSDFNVVSVQLKADKLNLMKGEKTNLHININGLEGWSFRREMKMSLVNESPQTVNLSFSREYVKSGNASGTRTIAGGPSSVNDSGRIAYTETLVGVSPGAFTINAVLFAPADQNGEETKEPTLKERVRDIARLKREAANAAAGNSDAKKDLERNADFLDWVAENKKNWDDEGGTKSKKGFKKLLQDEKKELDKKLVQVGAESEAGKKIIEAKGAIDAAAKAAGIVLDSK